MNITIDGCQQACAKKCLERVGASPTSIVLSELGYKKGESPVTEKNIESIVSMVKSKIPASVADGESSCCC
jgi:uncharacterized metal-binding protein